MLRPEGKRLPDVLWPPLLLLDLEANRKITCQEAKPDGDAVGMEPVADQVIEVMAVFAFFNRLPYMA